MGSGVVTSEKKISFYQNQRIFIAIFIALVSFFAVKYSTSYVWYKIGLPDRGRVTVANKALTVKQAYEVCDKVISAANKLYTKRKISLKERNRIQKEMQTLKQRIEKIYPVPSIVSLTNKRLYPYARKRAVIFYTVEVVLLLSAVVAFLLYDNKRLFKFFFQVGEIEEPLELGNPVDFIAWEYIGVPRQLVYSLFKDGEEGYWKIMSVFDEVITADERIFTPQQYERGKKVIIDFVKINKDIKSVLDRLIEYGKKNGLIKNGEEDHFKAVVGFALFHFVTSYFGNVPTGFLSVHLKDFTAKRVISTYSLAKIPNVKFFDTFKERELQPARYLRCLHSYRLVFSDVLEELETKHSQIPEVFPLKKPR